MVIKLVVGLGNPGREYEMTRHNIGFYMLDKFCEHLGLIWKSENKLKSFSAIAKFEAYSLILAKPTTFMNDSGEAVQKICKFYKILAENVIVLCDDISFEVGEFKITPRSGTAGHNGLADILGKIGTGFARFRVGIGQKTNKKMDLKDHVLSKFTADEQRIIGAMTPEILDDLQLLLDKGAEYSMNLINRRKNYGKCEKL